ncbi:hypothetical protein OROGR_030193 [Orobanche gracilis]
MIAEANISLFKLIIPSIHSAFSPFVLCSPWLLHFQAEKSALFPPKFTARCLFA